MIAQDKVFVGRDLHGTVSRGVKISRRHVGLLEILTIDENMSLANLDQVARQTDHTLDERFRAVQRIPEDNDVSAFDRFK